MTQQPQIIGRGGPRFVLILHGLHAYPQRKFTEFLVQPGHRLDEFNHGGIIATRLAELVHDLGEFAQFLALVHEHLAAHEIESLNAVGALINHRDASVAHQLFHTPFLDVAVAAKHLLGQHGAGKSVVGHERLGNRRQQRDQVVGVLASLFVRMLDFRIDQQRNPQRHGAAGFAIGLLSKQHAAYVRMNDDRVGRAGRVFWAGQGAHLQPFAGIGE